MSEYGRNLREQAELSRRLRRAEKAVMEGETVVTVCEVRRWLEDMHARDYLATYSARDIGFHLIREFDGTRQDHGGTTDPDPGRSPSNPDPVSVPGTKETDQ